MSVHMRKHPTKKNNNELVYCISEDLHAYKLPKKILEKYIVRNSKIENEIFGRFKKGAILEKQMSNIKQERDNFDPEEVFASINAKYTKTGALLKGVRLREGLSQKEFADLIDVTQGDLSKMERGLRPIGKIVATRISKLFGSRIL